MATEKRPAAAEDAVRRNPIDDTAMHVLAFVVRVERDAGADENSQVVADMHSQFVAGRLRFWLEGAPPAEALPRAEGRPLRELTGLHLALAVVYLMKQCHLRKDPPFEDVAQRYGVNAATVLTAYVNDGSKAQGILDRGVAGLLVPPDKPATVSPDDERRLVKLLADAERCAIRQTQGHALAFVVAVECDEGADVHSQFVAGRLRLWLEGVPAGKALPRARGNQPRELKGLSLALAVVCLMRQMDPDKGMAVQLQDWLVCMSKRHGLRPPLELKGVRLAEAVVVMRLRGRWPGLTAATVRKAYETRGSKVEGILDRGIKVLRVPPETRDLRES